MAKRGKQVSPTRRLPAGPAARPAGLFGAEIARSIGAITGGRAVTRLVGNLGSEQSLEKDAPQRFFYLVVKTDRQSAVNQDDIQSFFRAGANTNSDYIFVFVDLTGDDRLCRYLSAKPGGSDLYRQIEQEAPVFLISDKSLTNKKDVSDVRLVKIKDYDGDAAIIYHEMGFDSSDTRRAAIRFLKRVNRYFQLRPGIFGFGLNFNEMISDLLERLERRSP